MLTEKEAIVSVAVRHLQKALTRGRLTESAKVVENRRNYAIKNNSFALFLQEKCILHSGRTSRSVFNGVYKEWCKENNLAIEPMNQIKIMLEQRGITAMKSGEYYYPLTIY